MIRFTCEKCGTAIQVSDDLAGKQGRCPGCKTVVTIPSPGPAPSPPPAPEMLSPPPQAYAPPYAYAPMPPPGPSKALAICALVFGCLGFLPLLALVGIVLGAIALIAKKPGKPMAVTGLILGLVLGTASVTGGVLLMSHFRRKADRVRCASNLHQIHMAVMQYSNEYEDRLPPDLERLDRYLGYSRVWKCPSARSKLDCDYVYHAKPNARFWDADHSGMRILLCDRKGNHRDGRNVAFYDGAVRFMTEKEFQALLSERDNAEFAKHLRKLEGQ